jgi:hypothetical protein
MSEVKDESLRSKRIHCNQCKSETNHLLRGSHGIAYTYEEGYGEEFSYDLWICAGCDTGTLEIGYTTNNMYDPRKGEQIYDYTYHPSRNSGDITTKIFKKRNSSAGSG